VEAEYGTHEACVTCGYVKLGYAEAARETVLVNTKHLAFEPKSVTIDVEGEQPEWRYDSNRRELSVLLKVSAGEPRRIRIR
jgi:hypothetical protein